MLKNKNEGCCPDQVLSQNGMAISSARLRSHPRGLDTAVAPRMQAMASADLLPSLASLCILDFYSATSQD